MGVVSTTKAVTFAAIDPDPHSRIDRLPQPYRRIDKLVSEIIEDTLDEIDNKERRERELAARPKPTGFHPSVKYEDLGEVNSFAVSDDGRHMFVGNREGQLLVVHLPSRSVVVRSNVHPGPVERLCEFKSAQRGATLLASASKELMCVYLVGFEKSLLTLLCSGAPPSTRRAAVITNIQLTQDGKRCLVESSDGGVGLYNIPDPVGEGEEQGAAPTAARAVWLPPSHVAELIGATAGRPCVEVRFLSVPKPVKPYPKSAAGAGAGRGGGSDSSSPRPFVRTSSSSRLQSSSSPPSKSGGGHAAAPKPLVIEKEMKLAGLYVSWVGCNRLMYFDLLHKDAKQEPTGEPDNPAATTATRDWIVPYPVTCSCLMTDKQMLFVGLKDGSIVVWDTHLVTQVGVLNRLDAPVSCMAYVQSDNQLALLASATGQITLVDLDSLDFQRSDAAAMESYMQKLIKPNADGAIHAILRPELASSLVVLVRDWSVFELYDVNTQQTIGAFQAGPKSEYCPQIHLSSLCHSGPHGFLVVGTNSQNMHNRRVSTLQPDGTLVMHGDFATIQEESESQMGSKPSTAQDGQKRPTVKDEKPAQTKKDDGKKGGKESKKSAQAAKETQEDVVDKDPERVAFCAEQIAMFSVQEAFSRMYPDAGMSSMLATPMLQRMMAVTDSVPDLPQVVIQEGSEGYDADTQVLTQTTGNVLRSKTPKSTKKKQSKTDALVMRKSTGDASSSFKGPTLKDLKRNQGDHVERILENLQASGEVGRSARMKRMATNHAAMAAKYAAEAGVKH